MAKLPKIPKGLLKRARKAEAKKKFEQKKKTALILGGIAVAAVGTLFAFVVYALRTKELEKNRAQTANATAARIRMAENKNEPLTTQDNETQNN
jgi:hypothetical protein